MIANCLKVNEEGHLEISGCDHLVAAYSDLRAGTAEAEMPLPRSVRRVQAAGREGAERGDGTVWPTPARSIARAKPP